MLQGPARLLSALLLTLVLAWGSALSAAHMAPSQDEMARSQSAMAHGMGYDDLCGDMAGGMYHCPFCHALPRADLPCIAPAETRVVFHVTQARDGHLTFVRPPVFDAHAPRAPPARPV